MFSIHPKQLCFDYQKLLIVFTLTIAFISFNVYALEGKTTITESLVNKVCISKEYLSSDTIPVSTKSDSLRRAEAIAKKRKEIKDLFADGAFGKGYSGQGRAGSGQPISKGDPDGTAVIKGAGGVGGGLLNRAVVHTDTPVNDMDEEGNIVIKVCVNSAGDVISANFTLKGSTLTSEQLKKSAIEASKNWKFGESDLDTECGTITYRFKAR